MGASVGSAAWRGRRRPTVLDGRERAGQARAVATGRHRPRRGGRRLARVPDAVDLCTELGIATDLVSPGTGSAYLRLDGALQRLPPDQLLGVPTDLDALAGNGLLSPAGIERARQDLTLLDDRPWGHGQGQDESVGDLVRRRLGDEVLDRLVARWWAASTPATATGCRSGHRRPDRRRLTAPARSDRCGPPPPSVPGGRHLASPCPRPRSGGPAGRRAARRPGRRRAHQLHRPRPRRPSRRIPSTHTQPLAGPRSGRKSPRGSDIDSARPGRPEVVADAVVLATPAYASAPLLAPRRLGPCRASWPGSTTPLRWRSSVWPCPETGSTTPWDGPGFPGPAAARGCCSQRRSWTTTNGPPRPSISVYGAAGSRLDTTGTTAPCALPDQELVAAMLANLRFTMGLRADPVECASHAGPGPVPPASPRPTRRGGRRGGLARVRPGWP